MASNLLLEAYLKSLPPNRARRIRKIAYSILWTPILLLVIGAAVTVIMHLLK